MPAKRVWSSAKGKEWKKIISAIRMSFWCCCCSSISFRLFYLLYIRNATQKYFCAPFYHLFHTHSSSLWSSLVWAYHLSTGFSTLAERIYLCMRMNMSGKISTDRKMGIVRKFTSNRAIYIYHSYEFVCMQSGLGWRLTAYSEEIFYNFASQCERIQS